jgi:hypothetical protein
MIHWMMHMHGAQGAQPSPRTEPSAATSAAPLGFPAPRPVATSGCAQRLSNPYVVSSVAGFLSRNGMIRMSLLSLALHREWTPAVARAFTDAVLRQWETLASAIARELEAPDISPELRATALQALGWWTEAEEARTALLPADRDGQLQRLVQLALCDARPDDALAYALGMSALDSTTRHFCAMAWVLKGKAGAAELALSGRDAFVEPMILHLRNQRPAFVGLYMDYDVEPLAYCGNWKGALHALREALSLDLAVMQDLPLTPSSTMISASLPLSHIVIQGLHDNPHFARIIQRAMQLRDEHRLLAQAKPPQAPAQ